MIKRECRHGTKDYYVSQIDMWLNIPQYTETEEHFLQRINDLGEFVQAEYKNDELHAALYKTDAIEETQELKAAKEIGVQGERKMSNIRKTKDEWDAIYEEERRLKEEKLLTREEYEALIGLSTEPKLKVGLL